MKNTMSRGPYTIHDYLNYSKLAKLTGNLLIEGWLPQVHFGPEDTAALLALLTYLTQQNQAFRCHWHDTEHVVTLV